MYHFLSFVLTALFLSVSPVRGCSDFLSPTKEENLTAKQKRILKHAKEEHTAVTVWIVRHNSAVLKKDTISFRAEKRLTYIVTKRKKNGTVLTGHHPKKKYLAFHLSIVGQNLYGTFHSEDGYIYTIKPLGDGLQLLIKRDPRQGEDHPSK